MKFITEDMKNEDITVKLKLRKMGKINPATGKADGHSIGLMAINNKNQCKTLMEFYDGKFHRLASAYMEGIETDKPCGEITETPNNSNIEDTKRITVLIAYGPNNIGIPCRLFASIKEARAYCDPLFAKIEVIPQGADGHINYFADLENVEGGKEISKELFIDFSYGCGGSWITFTLEEIPFNMKFVRFDLD